jgi:ADP-ribose pyrophosphatase YjhB (NUDIX family)
MSETSAYRGFELEPKHRILVAVDAVVFSVSAEAAPNYRRAEDQRLELLLIKRPNDPHRGKWALPGGLVKAGETFEESVRRMMKKKADLGNIYLEQLYTFDDPRRDPRMRAISCAYLSLIDRSGYQEEQGRWFSLVQKEGLLRLEAGGERIDIKIHKSVSKNGRIKNKTYTVRESPLAFDHGSIILEGLLRLRTKLEYTDIAFNLTKDTFTLGELQKIYEIILGTSLISADFRRRIQSKIESTSRYSRGHGHRPSRLFRYRDKTI